MNDADTQSLLEFDDWTLFELEGQAFGLPAASIIRGITVSAVFPLPYSPDHVAGMTQVDGEVLPCMALSNLVSAQSADSGAQGGEAIVIQWQGRRAVIMVSRTLRQMSLDETTREQLTALDGLDDGGEQTIIGELTTDGLTVLLLNPGTLVAFSAAKHAADGRSGFFVDAIDTSKDSNDDVATDNLLLYVSIAGQQFALPVADCREIIALESVTPLPTAERTICGLTLLRGRSMLVIDPAAVLGLEGARRESAVVVSHGSKELIFAVDGIDAVRAVANHHIRPIDEGATITRSIIEIPGEPVRAVLSAERIIHSVNQLQKFMPSSDTDDRRAEEEATEAFLILRWSNERFAVPLESVSRIESISGMRQLNTDKIAGFISSDGEVVPVMQASFFYGMAGDDTALEGFVILNHHNQSFAIPVSETENISHVPVSHIQHHHGSTDSRFTGSIRLDGELITLVCLDPSAEASSQVESPS